MVFRGLAWTLLGIAVLFGILLLTLDRFINAPYIRDQIVHQVQQSTGRTLTLGKDMDVHVGLSPSLTLRDVALSNADFDTSGPMAQMKSLNLKIQFIPLIFGDIVIDELIMDQLILRATVAKDGRKNWDMSLPTKTTSPIKNQTESPAVTTDSTPAHIIANTVRITNSQVIFDDRKNQNTHTVTIGDLDLNRQKQGYDLAVNGVWQNQPVTVQASVEDILALLKQRNQTPIALDVTWADSSASMVGVIAFKKGAFAKMEGEFKADVKSLPSLLALRQKTPPFQVSTRFSYLDNNAIWTDLSLDVDGVALKSNGTSQNENFDAALVITSQGSPNLAKYLSVPLLQNPLSLKLRLQKKGSIITWSHLKGTLGTGTTLESDGNIRLKDAKSPKTVVQADIRSALIVLNDLHAAPLIPETVTEAESTTTPQTIPQTTTPTMAPPVVTLTWRQQPLYHAVMDAVSGVITASIDQVKQTVDGPDLFSHAMIKLKRDQDITLNAQASFGGGGAATVVLEDNNPTLQHSAITLNLDVTHPNIGALLKATDTTAAATGGEAHLSSHLSGSGATVQDVLQTLTGDVTLGMGPATIQSEAVLSSFISADLARAVLADQKTLRISCLATRWPFVKGVAHTPITLLESTAVRVTGTGSLNVAQNTLNMTITPTPKDAKLATIAVPLSVSGSINAPKITLGNQSLDALAGNIFSLIQNKGKLPPAPLPANDDICNKVLIPLKGGRFEVRASNTIAAPQTSQAPKGTKKELLNELRGLWR